MTVHTRTLEDIILRDMTHLASMADKLLDKCSKARSQQEQRMYSNKAEGLVTAVRFLGERYGIDTSEILKDFDGEVLV